MTYRLVSDTKPVNHTHQDRKIQPYTSCCSNPGILDRSPESVLSEFLDKCRNYVSNLDSLTRLCKANQRYLRDGQVKAGESIVQLQNLERRWYESLDIGRPDFSVYSDESYLAEAWGCWHVYSRKYLREIRLQLLDKLTDINSIIDLGCGVGLTTIAIRQLFPKVDIIATNLADSYQTQITNQFGRKYGFRVITEINQVNCDIDLVFASEYFEHFQTPIDHLDLILTKLKPKALLTANTFNSKSIGHFHSYLVNGNRLNGIETSRAFTKEMNRHGYVKSKTSFWNSRPAYWRKTENVIKAIPEIDVRNQLLFE